MNNTLWGLIAAATIPSITALLLIAPNGQETVIVIASTFIAVIFAWFFIKKNNANKSVQMPDAIFKENIRTQIKALLAPTHEFLSHLNKTDQDIATINENSHALEQEVELLFNKLDWVQSRRDSYQATILISDLRGFTSISETYSPDEIISMLNRYFELMNTIIYKHNGIVDKLMGDSILAVFGSFDGAKKDAEDAISCAAEMQVAMYKFNRENQRLGMPQLYMGIGLNTGEVVSSRLGSALYSEHTIIGRDVNLAARIESYTVRGQVLISESTHQFTKSIAEVGAPTKVIVKGKREAVAMYEVLSVTNPDYLKIPEREIRRSPRVDVNIPFKFHICEGKIITSEQYVGRISNISTGGMLAYSDVLVEPHFFVRFTLDFNLPGLECNDIYGKVLSVTKTEESYEMSIEFTIIDAEDRHSIQDLVNNTLAAIQREKHSTL